MSRLPAYAAFNMALAVALGAFGAHALKAQIEPDMLAVFKTGQEYHLVVGVVVLFLSLQRPSATATCRWLLVGTALFSGSLYVLAVTGQRVWGAVTPLGGVVWIASFCALALQLWRAPLGTPEPSAS